MTIRQGNKVYTYPVPYESGTWIQTKDGWKYQKDGKYAIGSVQIKGAWYFFNDDGIMQTGLVKRGKDYYWYDLKTGTLTKSSWISDGHYWRYFDEWGIAKKGWFKDASGKWCYLDYDTHGGKLVNEWFHDPFQKCWYRFNEKGWMVQNGVFTVDGKQYRFDGYGRTINADGKVVNTYEEAEVIKKVSDIPTINQNSGFKGYNVSPRSEKIQFIVIHYTGAEGTAKNNIDYFNSANRNASADFFVGHNGEIWQYNPYISKQYTWHCGGSIESSHHPFKDICKNANSIGVELCTHKVGSNWIFEDKTTESALSLVKWLMKQYGIDSAHVIRHYDVTGKNCPGVIGWGKTGGETKWLEWKGHLTASK